MKKSLNQSMIDATKWSAITEIVAKLISPITNMILARLLVPEAFGVVSTVTMIISFSDMFTDCGLQKYLVQHEFSNEKEKINTTNVAFWINLITSFIIWGGIILYCEEIASLVGNPGLGIVIAISCVQLPITSFSSIQMALYRRSLNYKTLFLVRILGIVTPFFVTIPLAYLGYSYWSLIIGSIVGGILNAIVLTVKSEWKPRLYFNFLLLKKMFSFSIWSFIESIIIWLSSWIDTFIIGNFLTMYYLGVYKTSLNTVNSIMAIVIGSTTPILFSVLSRLQNNEEKFNEVYFFMQKMVSYFLFPVGIGIFLYSDLVTKILLGNQWNEASAIIGIWALVNTIKVLFGNFCSEYYRAKGKPKISFLVQLSFLLLFVPICIFSAKYGFWMLIYGVTIGRLIIVIIHNITLYLKFKVSFLTSIRNVIIPIICTSIMGLSAIILKNYGEGISWDLFSIFICVLVYLSSILIFAKQDINKLILIKNNKFNSYLS